MGGACAFNQSLPSTAQDQHHDLRRTIEAIIWRHDNGAKWRQIPTNLGPWWMAAQIFRRWARLGAWERLLEAAQQHGGIEAGMAFLDGTNIRAHHKATGAAKKGGVRRSATNMRRLAARAAALAARPAWLPMHKAVPSALRWRPGRRTSCRWRHCW